MTDGTHDLGGRPPMPGSDGEHMLQDLYGTSERAQRFYRDQMLDELTPRMAAFVAVQTQLIVATADSDGRPDASVRFGEPGFVQMLDRHTLCWPELRGNGVLTTLGNIAKNPAVHLMFLDGSERIGLHLRGDARIVEPEQMADEHPAAVAVPMSGRPPERWVVVALETSYVHCRKHFPRSDAPIDWGTDDVRAKGGDYFGAKDTASPWSPAPTRPRPYDDRPTPTGRVKTRRRWLASRYAPANDANPTPP